MTTIKHTPIFKPALLRLFAILFISITIFSSCKKGYDDEPELQSALNVVNGTIGTQPIGFYINRQKVEGPALAYTQESGYFITFPGSRDFDIAVDGGGDYLYRTTLNLRENTYHTVFITGDAANLSSFFTTDDLTDPPSGKAKIRFANLSPDGGPLVISRKTGAELFSAQDYKTASGFITIDPGSYDIVLKTATGTELFEMNIGITAGRIYTLWSKGMRSGVSNAPIGLQFRSIN